MAKGNKKETLAKKEEYYSEQIRYFSQCADGAAVQQRLSQARVILLGAGALGTQTLLSLADAGVETIVVIDSAKITERDLPANHLLTIEDIGRARADAVVAHIKKRQYPYLKCEGVTNEIAATEELASIIKGVDCLLVCLDSPSPALLDLVNVAALAHNTHWLEIGRAHV